jgi:hypothetical protein
MRRVKVLCMAVLAAFVITAVVSSSAWAEPPEFGRCVKTAKGYAGYGYSDSGCTTAVAKDAKYEWIPGPNTEPGAEPRFTTSARYKPGPITKKCILAKRYEEKGAYYKKLAEEDEEAARIAESKGEASLAKRLWEEAEKNRKKQKEYEEKAKRKYEETKLPNAKEECETLIEDESESAEPVVLESVSGLAVECENLSGSGEYVSTKKVGDLKTTFTGCEVAETAIKCTSPGAKEGEIIPGTMQGELGVIKREGNPVNNAIGVDLRGESGSTIAEFDCGPFVAKVTGSVIHEVVTNRMIASENEKLVQKNGYQRPEKFEGLPADVLSVQLGESAPEQAGMGLLSKLKNDEKIEVATVA